MYIIKFILLDFATSHLTTQRKEFNNTKGEDDKPDHGKQDAKKANYSTQNTTLIPCLIKTNPTKTRLKTKAP